MQTRVLYASLNAMRLAEETGRASGTVPCPICPHSIHFSQEWDGSMRGECENPQCAVRFTWKST